MSSKQELIKSIQQEYAKVSEIDQDAETIYNEVKEQLRLHTVDPIALSPTSGDAAKIKYLAQRYAERYGAIAALLEQLDDEQKRAHFERNETGVKTILALLEQLPAGYPPANFFKNTAGYVLEIDRTIIFQGASGEDAIKHTKNYVEARKDSPNLPIGVIYGIYD